MKWVKAAFEKAVLNTYSNNNYLIPLHNFKSLIFVSWIYLCISKNVIKNCEMETIEIRGKCLTLL